MADFNVRADAVDVEQIMRQIRGRIRDKRGVDYTEEQIQELAKVKLEKFLDPRGVRSDLLEQFRQCRRACRRPIASTTRRCSPPTSPLVRFIRKLLQPVLKLLFNPNAAEPRPAQQVGINDFLIARTARDILVYEVVHNLVAGDDARQHRRQEHEDARGVDRQPPRVQRAAGARAGSGGPVPSRRRAWDAITTATATATQRRGGESRPQPAPCRAGPRSRPWIRSQAATACDRAASAAAAAVGADRGSGTRLRTWPRELRTKPRSFAPSLGDFAAWPRRLRTWPRGFDGLRPDARPPASDPASGGPRPEASDPASSES